MVHLIRKVIGRDSVESSLGKKRGSEERSGNWVGSNVLDELTAKEGEESKTRVGPRGRGAAQSRSESPPKFKHKETGNLVSDVKSIHMNMREKVILLEGMLTSLYEAAGHLQSHLDRFQSIRDQVISTTHLVNKRDPEHGLGRSIPYFLVPRNFTSETQRYLDLEKWNAETSAMCKEVYISGHFYDYVIL